MLGIRTRLVSNVFVRQFWSFLGSVVVLSSQCDEEIEGVNGIPVAEAASLRYSPTSFLLRRPTSMTAKTREMTASVVHSVHARTILLKEPIFHVSKSILGRLCRPRANQ